ncbi:MAG: hypothetical protein M0P73_15660 [Syntrophobacterales bacterium]|jgi:hypothetical protein|nr:hypothetical protein [Syntrophobacterales bacterium]
MSRFFNFYDPLEKRYIFNSFLVVVGLVEILILVFTLIWQMDEGIFTGQPVVIPFPWSQYLLAAFVAPIALLFLFGLIIQGFEMLGKEAAADASPRGRWGARLGRWRYLLGLLGLMVLVVFLVQGRAVFALLTAAVKFIGLGGSYIFITLLAMALLYLPLRLWLRYRLETKAMEYQYLLTLAERHGVVVVDPKLHPELAAELEEKKNLSAPAVTLLPPPDFPEDSGSN